MATEIITDDGEVIQLSEGETVNSEILPLKAAEGTETSMVLAKAEIDIQIATARRYPRAKPAKIAEAIKEFATIDEETAEECLYALVRSKKRVKRKRDDGTMEDREATKKELVQMGTAIEGPSIRLAEIAAICWGNNRNGYRPVMIDRQEKVVIAEGVFLDLETNVATTSRVSRSIRTREGGIFQPDMISVTMNAAGAIAKRNAILAGIPKGVTRVAYQAARAVVVGTQASLVETRKKVFLAFARHGVTPEMILDKLDLDSESDIGLDEVAVLRGMRASLKNGEETVERMFGADPRIEARTPMVQDPLSEKEPEAELAKPEEKTESVSPESAATPDAEQAATDDMPIPSDAGPAGGGEADPGIPGPGAPESPPVAAAAPANGIAPARAPKRQAKDKLPTRATEYGEYLTKSLVPCTTATACDEVFKGQRRLRVSLGAVPEHYTAIVDARKEEIAKGSANA